MAQKDISISPRADRSGTRAAAGKRSRITPMAQQRPDLGTPSAQQTLVQLVGSSDPNARADEAARRRQAARRSRRISDIVTG